MKIRKVTPEVFDKVKYLGKMASIKDVAEQTGLSQSTVTKIVNHCSDYRDYQDYLETSGETIQKRIKDAQLAQLTGEPLFWRVHSDLRLVSSKAISRYSGLPYDKVVRMKQAIDYQSFLNIERSQTMSRGKKVKITGIVFDEIKRQASEGQPLQDIAFAFGLSPYTVRKVIYSRDLDTYRDRCRTKPRKKKTKRTKAKVNRQVFELVKRGIDAGYPYAKIANCLHLSHSTVSRIAVCPTYNVWLRTHEDIYKRHSLDKCLGSGWIAPWEFEITKEEPKPIEEEVVQEPEPEPETEPETTTIEPEIEEEPKQQKSPNEDFLQTFALASEFAKAVSSVILGKMEIEKYKYRWIFILTGIGIVGLLALGFTALLR